MTGTEQGRSRRGRTSRGERGRGREMKMDEVQKKSRSIAEIRLPRLGGSI